MLDLIIYIFIFILLFIYRCIMLFLNVNERILIYCSFMIIMINILGVVICIREFIMYLLSIILVIKFVDLRIKAIVIIIIAS
jgi:hypothetical protein